MVLIIFIVLVCYVSIFNDFLPKTRFGSGIPDIDAFRALSYLLVIGSTSHWAIKKDIRFFNRWLITLLAFYIIVFASVAWSNFNYSAAILRQLFDTTFITFFIALVALNLFKKENNARLYIKNIIFTAFVLSIISVLQVVLGFLQGEIAMRATGTFTNPNKLAILLVLTIPCLLYAKEKFFIPKLFWWITTISVITGVIVTASRKGIITMFICFCLYSFLKKKYKQLAYILIAFIFLGVGISGFSMVSDRFEQTFFSKSLHAKWELTYAGLQMFAESPLYGLGFEVYREHYADYFPDRHRKKYSAHNMFITAAANFGVIGFIPFLSLFFIPLFASYKTIRNKNKNNNEHSSDMAIICIASIIPFMINGWFADIFFSTINISLLFSNISLFLTVKK